MIYQVNLDSSNKYAGTNNAQLTYAVDWSFLPENKKFKVTFSFLHKKRSVSGGFSSNFTNYIECNFGSAFENYSGSSVVEKRQNYFLGIILPKKVFLNNATENILCALPPHNKPVYIHSRPSNNFVTITIRQNTFALSSVISDYSMALFFEEID